MAKKVERGRRMRLGAFDLLALLGGAMNVIVIACIVGYWLLYGPQ